MVAASVGGRGAVAGVAGAAATGTGTASKATVISNGDVDLEVRDVSAAAGVAGRARPVAGVAAAAVLLAELGALHADAGDAVDVPQRGEEARDAFLAVGAAADLQRRDR